MRIADQSATRLPADKSLRSQFAADYLAALAGVIVASTVFNSATKASMDF
jgi:hypothetical protein